MLNVDNAINELNKIMVNTIEDTVKIAEKYGLDKNETVKEMGEKINFATQLGDFSNYEYRRKKDVN